MTEGEYFAFFICPSLSHTTCGQPHRVISDGMHRGGGAVVVERVWVVVGGEGVGAAVEDGARDCGREGVRGE